MSRAISVGKIPQSANNPNCQTFEERAVDLAKEAKAEEEARRREKNSPYTSWVQQNLKPEYSKALRRLTQKHPIARTILEFLVEHMDNYNAVMCSYAVLQEALEISKASVARSVGVLKEQGFIAVFKSGTSNVYTVNDDLYWKSWGKNRHYSKFPANVILSVSEQEEQIKLQVEKHKEITLKEDE